MTAEEYLAGLRGKLNLHIPPAVPEAPTKPVVRAVEREVLQFQADVDDNGSLGVGAFSIQVYPTGSFDTLTVNWVFQWLTSPATDPLMIPECTARLFEGAARAATGLTWDGVSIASYLKYPLIGVKSPEALGDLPARTGGSAIFRQQPSDRPVIITISTDAAQAFVNEGGTFRCRFTVILETNNNGSEGRV